jgi:hypothetical protein
MHFYIFIYSLVIIYSYNYCRYVYVYKKNTHTHTHTHTHTDLTKYQNILQKIGLWFQDKSKLMGQECRINAFLECKKKSE